VGKRSGKKKQKEILMVAERLKYVYKWQ